jgi:uncharacterized protein GlcG (DUF336 family)
VGVIAINGGVPIKVGNDTIGGVGLSGSPGKDEECVNAGLEKVKQYLQGARSARYGNVVARRGRS